MTRSRVCPDTESTCLSPASDALPETAIRLPTASRRRWYVINSRRMNRRPGSGLRYRTRMSSSITPVLMPVFPAICWPARDRYSAVCWPGPATPATGPREQLLTRTVLLKAGYSRATIAAMTQVAERQVCGWPCAGHPGGNRQFSRGAGSPLSGLWRGSLSLWPFCLTGAGVAPGEPRI